MISYRKIIDGWYSVQTSKDKFTVWCCGSCHEEMGVARSQCSRCQLLICWKCITTETAVTQCRVCKNGNNL